MDILRELTYAAEIESLEDRILELEAVIKLLLDGEVQKNIPVAALPALHRYDVHLDWPVTRADLLKITLVND